MKTEYRTEGYATKQAAAVYDSCGLFLRPGLRILGSSGPAALIIRLFVVLAFQRFGLLVSHHARLIGILLLLLLLLQLLAHRFGQIDFPGLLVFRHHNHLLKIEGGCPYFKRF